LSSGTVLLFKRNNSGAKIGGRSSTESHSGKDSPLETRPTFYSIAMRAVDLALAGTLGHSGATAVKFYVDTSLIYEDPSLFEESLSRLFGSSSTGLGLIEERIRSNLQDILAKECSINFPEVSSTGPGNNFSQFIQSCKKEFSARQVSMSPNPS
jgi:hypothetical protein